MNNEAAINVITASIKSNKQKLDVSITDVIQCETELSISKAKVSELKKLITSLEQTINSLNNL